MHGHGGAVFGNEQPADAPTAAPASGAMKCLTASVAMCSSQLCTFLSCSICTAPRRQSRALITSTVAMAAHVHTFAIRAFVVALRADAS